MSPVTRSDKWAAVAFAALTVTVLVILVILAAKN